MTTGTSSNKTGRKRGAEQTRARILEAAMNEFMAKGYAGARVETVAESADVNIRTLYQYFDNKSGLAAAVFGDSFQVRHASIKQSLEALLASREVAPMLPAFHHTLADSLEWVRLVAWDALSVDLDASPDDMVASDVRRKLYSSEVDLLRKFQVDRLLPDELEADLLLLAMMALATFPSIVRPLTMVIAGQDPASPEFKQRYDRFLSLLTRYLSASPGDLDREVVAAGVVSSESKTTVPGPPALQRTVRMAARAIGRNGLSTAYGHVSARLDSTSFLVCAPKPMGIIEREEGTVVAVDGDLPPGVLGEVAMHQAIYRARPDVGGISRFVSPAVVAVSAFGRTPRARIGFGAYFAPQPPLWPDPLLVRSAEMASAVAEMLGNSSAIVLRGNGAITVADTIEKSVVLASYLEESARVEQLALQSTEPSVEYTAGEAAARAVWSGGLVDRMWSYLTAGDPEQ